MKTYFVITSNSGQLLWETNEEEINKFLPLIDAIRNFQLYEVSLFRHDASAPFRWKHNDNWPEGERGCKAGLGGKNIYELYNEYVDESIIEQFNDLVPKADEGNVHTIKSIKLIKVIEEKELLK